jgi:hypothetical protein
MSDFVGRYERQFHSAATRVLQRRRPRTRRVAVVALAVLAAVGVPAAADNDWLPFAGRDDAPTSSRHAPAAGLRAELAVLRRPQTAAERQAATYALRFFGPTFGGVQVAYIREAGGVIIVPAKTHQLTPGSAVDHDVVCMWRTDAAGDGGARGCFTAAQIAAGDAVQSLGGEAYMLVPDGVATVAAGPGARSTVHDNVASWRGGLASSIGWYDRDGKLLRTIVH